MARPHGTYNLAHRLGMWVLVTLFDTKINRHTLKFLEGIPFYPESLTLISNPTSPIEPTQKDSLRLKIMLIGWTTTSVQWLLMKGINFSSIFWFPNYLGLKISLQLYPMMLILLGRDWKIRPCASRASIKHTFSFRKKWERCKFSCSYSFKEQRTPVNSAS